MDIKNLAGTSALDLFPDLFADASKEKKSKNTIPAPPPPDISWLINGMVETATSQTDASLTALVVIVAEQAKTMVEKGLIEMGYAVDTALSMEQAIQKLQTVQYNVIICGTDITLRDLHQYICRLSSPRRRKIYYALVGPRLHTLYNLEALALSANLVINDQDLQELESILRKGLSDYEHLFRPLLDCLSIEVSFH